MGVLGLPACDVVCPLQNVLANHDTQHKRHLCWESGDHRKGIQKLLSSHWRPKHKGPKLIFVMSTISCPRLVCSSFNAMCLMWRYCSTVDRWHNTRWFHRAVTASWISPTAWYSHQSYALPRKNQIVSAIHWVHFVMATQWGEEEKLKVTASHESSLSLVADSRIPYAMFIYFKHL